jgi:predicted alpha/beta superfamily hydrolase
MLKIHMALALPICILVVGGSSAQQLQPRPYPIPELVESFSFQSPSMGERYALSVGIPADFKAGERKTYATLIVTDGDSAFPSANSAARSLRAEIEPMFVISIGTPQEDGREAYSRRRRYEFSPPGWDRKDPFGEYITKACTDSHTPPDKCTGGAPKFLNAIVKEMLPLLEAKFPIDPNRLGIYGSSAGGFFAAWAIFQPDSPFKKYLISSPAMGQGNGVVFRDEERYSKAHTDLPVWIYFGAGALRCRCGGSRPGRERHRAHDCRAFEPTLSERQDRDGIPCGFWPCRCEPGINDAGSPHAVPEAVMRRLEVRSPAQMAPSRRAWVFAIAALVRSGLVAPRANDARQVTAVTD